VSVRYNIEWPGVIAIENFGNFCQAVFVMDRDKLDYRSARLPNRHFVPSHALRIALGAAALWGVVFATAAANLQSEMVIILFLVPILIIPFFSAIGIWEAGLEMHRRDTRLRWSLLALLLSVASLVLWGWEAYKMLLIVQNVGHQI
jgi:hypothetical protein